MAQNGKKKNKEDRVSPKISKDEILIDGRIYDISSFKKKHPGGSIISFYEGADASESWREFHSRSNIAKKNLNLLKSRPQKSDSPEIIKDFLALRKELEEEGYFKPSYSHIAYRIIELIILHIIGFYFLVNGYPIIGIFIFSLANGRCGWLMHEGGHGSITGNLKIDKIIQSMLFGLGNGMSGAYWNNQHNKHHASPQKLEYDVDIKTLPLIAFNLETAKKAKKVTKMWLRFQAFLFAPVVTVLVTLFWALFLHPRYMIYAKKPLEMGCYILRWIFVLKYLSLELFLLNAFFGGIYIFVNFAVSHTHKPTVSAEEFPNWIEYAANHTSNITPSWWCDWWMGYLNYQIEHHLFPTMPQFRQSEIAPRVKKLFEKHGLKYDVVSYTEALKKTFKNLHYVGTHA